MLLSLIESFDKFSDSNQCIFVYKDDMWAMKGCFETALKDDDNAVWTFVDGQDILWVLVVCIYFSVTHFNLLKLWIG